MKKSLSILLCLCLLTGCFISLIPTATAAVTSTGVGNPERFPAMKKAELVYSESFEGDEVTGAETTADLIDALGWSGTAFPGMEIRTDSGSGNHQLFLKSDYESMMTVCTDDRLAGGNYVIEYTATMLTFASGADGAGMGFRSSYQEETAGWNFLTKERGNFDFHFHTANIAAENYHEETDIAPAATTVNGTKRANGSVVGQTIRFRLVIDAKNGLSAYTVNETTGEAAIVVGMNADCVESWANNSSTLNNTVMIRTINIETSFLVDDIQIWSTVESEPIPEMIGYQVASSQSGTCDVRFLAGIRLPENLEGVQSLGFHVDHAFPRFGFTVHDEKDIISNSLYQSLTANYGRQTLTAISKKYDYLISLTVTNIPTNRVNTFTVTPFVVIEEEGTGIRKSGKAQAYTVDGLLDSIPAPIGGTRASAKEFTSDHYRLHYTRVTQAEYEAYAEDLTHAGFTLYGENAIGNNLYKTYTSDSVMLHAYYIANMQIATVLVTEKENWTAYPQAPKADEAVTDPNLMMMDMNYLAQTGGQNNGMGFVYTLEDGSYVIIDGGWASEAEALYSYLAENNKRTDGKILIRAWIITHPDKDHFGCWLEFTKNHAEDVTLEYFVAQFEQSHITAYHTETIDAIFGCIDCYADCKTIVPMAGQVMYFGTLKVEFLFTAEMYQGYTGSDLTGPQTNESSLAFKTYLGDTDVLFTGDILGTSIDIVTNYYGSALKCQYFQAPHHGLNGTREFYDAVNCEYLLMTTHSTATAQRLTSSHAHGQQSKLYYLMNLTGMNAETDVFSAGEKDDVSGDELTVIPIQIPNAS